MTGDNLRVCQPDKTWQPTAPICVKCASLGLPESGDATITSDGYTSTAQYVCSHGYRMIGTDSRTCHDDGSWDGAVPTCVCEAPFAPNHGSLVSTGKTSNYTCDVGFSMQGSNTRTCNTDGSGWSGSDPTCNLCTVFSAPVGGAVSMETTGTQTFALFSCAEGYTLTGAYKVYCDSQGYWEMFPKCAMCDTLDPPTSGNVSTYTTGRRTIARYACAAGYDLIGITERMCLTDGSWEQVAPTCQCASPLPPTNGHVLNDGIQATYTCDLGYSLDGNVSRTCQEDGSGWAGADPVCYACAPLDALIGGGVAMATTDIETQASFTCGIGYTLNGHQTIICSGNGTWDFSPPECVLCPTLMAPTSGYLNLASNTLTTTAKFACVTGYYVSGTLSSTCRSDGTWNKVPPKCKCSAPTSPGNGSVSVSELAGNQIANYQCELGYSISGLAYRNCQADGTGWEDADPKCSRCAPMSTTPEMRVTIATNGTTTMASYACALNYSLAGEAEHICTPNGTWNVQTPSCVSCPSKSSPAGGSVHLVTDGLMTSAIYTCNPGYNLNSTSINTCQSDGVWAYPDPMCVCNPPAALVNGNVIFLADGMIANFSCTAGYELVGSSVLYCFTDGGGWNGTVPQCEYIEQTTVKSVASREGTYLAISAGVFIFLVVLVILLMAILAVISICCYIRYRKERYRIGTDFRYVNNTPAGEEPQFHLDNPETTNGKTVLIRDSDTDSLFSAKSLQKKPLTAPVQAKKKTKKTPRNETENQTKSQRNASNQNMSLLNGIPLHNGALSQNVPMSSIRLPKLPARPPDGHSLPTKPKRKRRRTDRLGSAKRRTDRLGSGGGSRRSSVTRDVTSVSPETVAKTRDAAPTSPEVVAKPRDVPDIVPRATCSYMKHMHYHEAGTPIPTRSSKKTDGAIDDIVNRSMQTKSDMQTEGTIQSLQTEENIRKESNMETESTL